MTNEEAIKFLKQLYPYGGHCWLDGQRTEAIGMAIKALQEEPANDDFEAEVKKLWEEINTGHNYSIVDSYNQFFGLCMDIADWQKENLWKPADGEDLPEINREVIALLGWGKVVFAHRPPEFWDGKDIVTGKVTRNYPKTYDKGGWNIPDVKYWLDVELPKEIEL